MQTTLLGPSLHNSFIWKICSNAFILPISMSSRGTPLPSSGVGYWQEGSSPSSFPIPTGPLRLHQTGGWSSAPHTSPLSAGLLSPSPTALRVGSGQISTAAIPADTQGRRTIAHCPLGICLYLARGAALPTAKGKNPSPHHTALPSGWGLPQEDSVWLSGRSGPHRVRCLSVNPGGGVGLLFGHLLGLVCSRGHRDHFRETEKYSTFCVQINFNPVVQIFCILSDIFCLLILSITEWVVLKSPSMIVNFSISPF